MKNLKKLSALVLALVMALSLCVNAGAATSDPNFTAAPGTAWSTEVVAGGSAVIAAGPAGSNYVFSGYSSKADAENAAVTFNCGEELVVDANNDGKGDYSVAGIETSTGVWAAQVTMNIKTDVTGAISVKVAKSSAANAPSVDLTVYVEAAEDDEVAIADGVYVKVKDVRTSGGTTLELEVEDITVAPIGDSTQNTFYSQTATAKSYPTALGALENLIKSGLMTVSASGGYVSSITPANGTALAAYSDDNWNYYGWNYCVVRDGEIQTISYSLSASVMQLEADDEVYWAFGTYSEASAYFSNLVTP